LVVGPFANLSDDFMVLCDFLGRARALKAMYSWNINQPDACPGNEPTSFGGTNYPHGNGARAGVRKKKKINFRTFLYGEALSLHNNIT
jgi:hypothetical protein